MSRAYTAMQPQGVPPLAVPFVAMQQPGAHAVQGQMPIAQAPVVQAQYVNAAAVPQATVVSVECARVAPPPQTQHTPTHPPPTNQMGPAADTCRDCGKTYQPVSLGTPGALCPPPSPQPRLC